MLPCFLLFLYTDSDPTNPDETITETESVNVKILLVLAASACMAMTVPALIVPNVDPGNEEVRINSKPHTS